MLMTSYYWETWKCESSLKLVTDWNPIFWFGTLWQDPPLPRNIDECHSDFQLAHCISSNLPHKWKFTTCSLNYIPCMYHASVLWFIEKDWHWTKNLHPQISFVLFPFHSTRLSAMLWVNLNKKQGFFEFRGEPRGVNSWQIFKWVFFI